MEALQRKLGVSADGRIGPSTLRALQRKLGTPVDGRVSNPSVMVRELQKNLNAGKLW
ncbi:peptidoglycan-binding protein [Brevibacterium aurantiacum]|uniref:peptidoglycan-binding protein n=1 Tax=Brevibacterium aurantiacum TaxID=273384 RepID=UPI0011AF845A|nr:peptidoglycan-binding protein [Brevibacterium aurantiacum]